MITEVHFDFSIQRQINVRSRTELNQADALAFDDLIARFNIGNNAASNDAGNQPQAELYAGGFGALKAKQGVFVALRAFSANGVHKLALGIFEEAHFSTDGGI